MTAVLPSEPTNFWNISWTYSTNFIHCGMYNSVEHSFQDFTGHIRLFFCQLIWFWCSYRPWRRCLWRFKASCFKEFCQDCNTIILWTDTNSGKRDDLKVKLHTIPLQILIPKDPFSIHIQEKCYQNPIAIIIFILSKHFHTKDEV